MSKETFGTIPLPPQLKELDKEVTVRTFLELMHQVGCGCQGCKREAQKTARVLTFGGSREMQGKAITLAAREREVVSFKKTMDRDLKYL